MTITVNSFDDFRCELKPNQQVYIDFPGDEGMLWTAYEGSATLIKRYKKTWIGKGEHWLVSVSQKGRDRDNETFFPIRYIYPPLP